jgi:electron-transferring-flavoprotein dehydrogenase
MAAVARDYGPADWDRTFAAADTIVNRGQYSWWSLLRSGLTGIQLYRTYKRTKDRFRDGNYVQLRESEYTV